MFDNPFKTLQIIIKYGNGDVLMLFPLTARALNIIRIIYFVRIVIKKH